MMTKKTLMVAVLAMFATSTVFAQTNKIKDVRTNPDLFFLEDGQQASSLDLLPPPPAQGTMPWFYDEARYVWGKSLRDTPRGDQAAADARVEGDGVPMAFSEAFGTKISKETTPEIYTLVLKMREDAGDLATRSAKIHYMRIRPFAYYKEDTCNPEQQKALSPMVPIPPATPPSAGLRLWCSPRLMSTVRTRSSSVATTWGRAV